MAQATATRGNNPLRRRVYLTQHSLKRLQDGRQEGIELDDLIAAARSIPGYIARATRFRNFISRLGARFDLILRDLPHGRLIITVIGKERDK